MYWQMTVHPCTLCQDGLSFTRVYVPRLYIKSLHFPTGDFKKISDVDCWEECDKTPGECNVCTLGSGESKLTGYCCKKGDDGCPEGADKEYPKKCVINIKDGE